MKIILALMMLACALTAVSAPVDGPSADALLQRIGQQGGHQVLRDLWKDDAAFDHVTGGIESGDPKWLEVAIALRPFSDAGASEAIDNAVARVLPIQPRRILSMVGHGFELDHICTSPFIEPAPGIAEAYEKKTLAALASVKDRNLAHLARECARRVRLPGRQGRMKGN